MSIPDTAREYRLPKYASGIQSLAIHHAPVAKPKPEEVLVKIHAVSLNYRDLAICTGHYPMEVKDALVICSDCSGEIVSVGDNVQTQWKIGDRVCVNVFPTHKHGQADDKTLATVPGGLDDGVLVEYRTFPQSGLVRVPEHLTYEEASTLGGAGLTAYVALTGPVPLKGGDTVLVLGTGGVSMFALQFAVASGATVIATSSSDNKLAIAQKHGAHHLINYNKNPNWDEEVLKVTNGRGVDHIIEVGGAGTLAKSFRSVSYGGWIHSIGFLAEGGEQVNAGFATIMKGCVLRGILGLSVSQFEDMNRFISAAQIRPVVDKVFPFEVAQEALEYLGSQKFVGKVVIKVAQE
ncbi:NAD(P)-binding protein [Athelia psychrophila]|uniref:NAD(P)-binding protein n=1 Tax=Athelia psychrophila TaxID=1759441 RepID=A0A166VXQ2_9AGAM|nr:NAD(P)-binding protein [Fibularhizoctonia sp. CBS 109695]